MLDIQMPRCTHGPLVQFHSCSYALLPSLLLFRVNNVPVGIVFLWTFEPAVVVWCGVFSVDGSNDFQMTFCAIPNTNKHSVAKILVVALLPIACLTYLNTQAYSAANLLPN